MHDAFVEGNVGIVQGLDVVVFLKLEISDGSANIGPEKYPMSYLGFSNFLMDQIAEVHSTSLGMLPQGLQELMKSTQDANIPDHMVIYHPEFLPLEGIASLYLQGWRILRREMPALGEWIHSYDAILQLDKMLSSHYFQICLCDDIVKSWLGVHKPKSSSIPALLGLSNMGSTMNHNALTPSDWAQFKYFLGMVYGPSGQSGLQGRNANTATYTTPSGVVIPKNPKEAAVLDVHRHCIAHAVENESVEAKKRLEVRSTVHRQSFQKKEMGWRDCIHLMMHRFSNFPHCLVTVFENCCIWSRLDMESKLPIPKIYHLASAKS